jgi:hypothetical protein
MPPLDDARVSPRGMAPPGPRGPLSATLTRCLPSRGAELPADPPIPASDALADDDLQLALFLCHELNYGGVRGVADEWEWRPSFVAFRSLLEREMLARLIEEVGPPEPVAPESVPEEIFALVAGDATPPLSRYLEARATLEQFREFVVHRSAYQLKEADPHTFAIPRIGGAAKAAMVEVQADEYGGGDPERMHSTLFARTMRELGLDATFGTYVALLPATTLATVNLISLFGLRRRWRGALVGHLACFEITSPQPNRRYANGLRRLRLGPRATEFYDEHVEADSVHENIAAHDLAGGLARQEPELAGDILFGVRSLLHCEGRFAASLLAAWEAGRSSLLGPLAPARAD